MGLSKPVRGKRAIISRRKKLQNKNEVSLAQKTTKNTKKHKMSFPHYTYYTVIVIK